MEEVYQGFYLNAGISIEHLLKARLSQTHPVLIADPKHFDTMLIMVQSEDDALPAPIMRTIGLTESLARCSKLVAQVSKLGMDVRRIADYRNGAAHAGLVRTGDVKADVLAAVRLIDVLLTDMDYSRKRYYSEYLDSVDIWLDQSRSQVDGEATAVIAGAREGFQRRYPQGPPGSNVEESLNSHAFQFLDHQPYECPACGSQAILSGDLYPEWAPEDDNNKGDLNSRLTVYLLPSGLECRLCGLAVDGARMGPAGIPDEIMLDDIDPEDWLDEGENAPGK